MTDLARHVLHREHSVESALRAMSTPTSKILRDLSMSGDAEAMSAWDNLSVGGSVGIRNFDARSPCCKLD
jgi:hypothetical protein